MLVGETTKRATRRRHRLRGRRRARGEGQGGAAAALAGARASSPRAGRGPQPTALEAPFVGRDRELRLVKDLFHARRRRAPAQPGLRDRRRRHRQVAPRLGVLQVHRRPRRSTSGGTAAAACPTARASPTGRSPRWCGCAPGSPRTRTRPRRSPSSTRRCDEHVPDPDERDCIEPRLAASARPDERTGSDRDDLFSAWRLFFERLAEHDPVVIVFEDLQWADAGAARLRRAPARVVAQRTRSSCSRSPGRSLPSATPASAAGCARRPRSRSIRSPTRRWTSSSSASCRAPGRDVRATIRERADGIPLYAVETVRMLLDRGLLAPEGDATVSTGDLDALDVPETLHALIAARLDGLEPEERRLAPATRPCSARRSARGARPRSAASRSERRRAPCSPRSWARRCSTLDADPRSPERGQYGFLQALVQRVAYETLSRHDRQALHLAAADLPRRGCGHRSGRDRRGDRGAPARCRPRRSPSGGCSGGSRAARENGSSGQESGRGPCRTRGCAARLRRGGRARG